MKNLSRRRFVQNLGIGVGATAIAAALPSFKTAAEKKKKSTPVKN